MARSLAGSPNALGRELLLQFAAPAIRGGRPQIASCICCTPAVHGGRPQIASWIRGTSMAVDGQAVSALCIMPATLQDTLRGARMDRVRRPRGAKLKHGC